MGMTEQLSETRLWALVIRLSDRLVQWLGPLAVANLVMNVLIVVTGGAVRLTASGLGCPTWPRCTEDSFTPHGELGLHGAIEFGNRLVTILVTAVAVLCILAAWRSGRRRTTRLALGVATVVPAQIVIGGITVLSKLNPWVVAFHFLVSMAIVGLCVMLLDDIYGRPRAQATRSARRLAWATFAVAWVALYLGTVVTGSGPHAGDIEAPRNGLDPRVMSHVHAASVYVLVALTLALLVLAVRRGDRRLATATGVLLLIEVGQGVVGFVQYFLDLPALLVGLHMLGAALVSASVTWVVTTTQDVSA